MFLDVEQGLEHKSPGTSVFVGHIIALGGSVFVVLVGVPCNKPF